MTNRPSDLQAILTDVRRRWTLRSLLRAWTTGAAAAAVVVLAGIGATFVAGEGFPLIATSALVVTISLFLIGYALWPFRRQPSDRQLARFIEERVRDLDDVVVTAVDARSRPGVSERMRELLTADADRALAALDLDAVVAPDSLRRAGIAALVATLALGSSVAFFAPALSTASDVAFAYLFPARLTVEVSPGAAKVRAGQPFTITARIGGIAGGVVPSVSVAVDKDVRSVRMSPAGGDRFTLTIEKVTAPFVYAVSAAGAKSGDYAVSVIRPPRVDRGPTRTAATSTAPPAPRHR
jgi:hypothetical protein